MLFLKPIFYFYFLNKDIIVTDITFSAEVNNIPMPRTVSQISFIQVLVFYFIKKKRGDFSDFF